VSHDRLSGLPDRWQLDGAGAVPAAVAAAAVRLLPIDGAAVLLMRDRTRWSTAAATDSTITAVADLQQTVGEGPSVEAYVSGGPVLVPDLAAARRWPALLPSFADVRAFFSFPLQLGAVRFGVLDLYRRTPGRLGRPALADALRLADLAAAALVHDPGAAVDDAGGWPLDVDFRPEIDQASGMLSVHLGVDIAAAYARLRGHAFAAGLPLADVAAAVVAGTLRIDGDVGRPPDPGR
jgi:GAF domain-containing protein/ANTAR domain-containing protein